MKKESLSIIFVKTLLAVLLFAGMGTIIIGGGYIIWEYSKCATNNQITKPINQETENYYDILEKKCTGDNCCISSLKTMRANNHKEADENGKCPEGFFMNMMKCITSYQWCEPIGENCAKAGEFVNPDNLKGKTNYPDVCCEGLKGVNAYKVNENDECEIMTGTPYLTCVPCGNGICDEIDLWFENKCNCPEDCKEETDTSDWQTYRNEEFGFEVKYPEDWEFEANLSKNKFSTKSREEITPILDIYFKDEEYSEVLAKEQKSFNEWQEKSIEKLSGEINDIVFAGSFAKEFLQYSPIGFIQQRIILSKNDKTIVIDSYKGSVLDSVLSTFKFIEAVDPTADWQTYRNEEFGFEFEYPGYFGASEKNNTVSLINYYDSSQKIEILKHSGPSPETMDMESVGTHKVLVDEYVSNIELFQGRFDNNKDKYYLRVFIFEKDIYYHAETDKDKIEELSSIFNQILSTFKFIEN